MTNKSGFLSGLALLLASASAAPAVTPSDDCAVLDELLSKARTDFTALKWKRFGGAHCAYEEHEFNCEWTFSTDRYGDAETQIERLERCTAAQPDAEPLTATRDEATFQIDPETSVVIRGPDPDSGYWKLKLKILTTADWE